MQFDVASCKVLPQGCGGIFWWFSGGFWEVFGWFFCGGSAEMKTQQIAPAAFMMRPAKVGS